MNEVATARRVRMAPFVALALAIVATGLLVVLATSNGNASDTTVSFLLGRPAPGVTSTTLDGEQFDLSRRKGSWVFLNFFDPTCVPCVAEHPELTTFVEQHPRVSSGVEFYTIVNRGSDDDVRRWFDERGGADWPVVRDPNGSISVAFGVAQVPETWLIDPNGVVRVRWTGQVTAAGLTKVLEELDTG